MSIKRQSQFLLIRISQGGLRRLVIPVPLYVLDLTLTAFGDLARLVDALAPHRLRALRRFHPGGAGGRRVSVEFLWTACTQLLDELRKYGRLRLVEVQAGRVRVFIDFY